MAPSSGLEHTPERRLARSDSRTLHLVHVVHHKSRQCLGVKESRLLRHPVVGQRHVAYLRDASRSHQEDQVGASVKRGGRSLRVAFVRDVALACYLFRSYPEEWLEY